MPICPVCGEEYVHVDLEHPQYGQDKNGNVFVCFNMDSECDHAGRLEIVSACGVAYVTTKAGHYHE